MHCIDRYVTQSTYIFVIAFVVLALKPMMGALDVNTQYQELSQFSDNILLQTICLLYHFQKLYYMLRLQHSNAFHIAGGGFCSQELSNIFVVV